MAIFFFPLRTEEIEYLTSHLFPQNKKNKNGNVFLCSLKYTGFKQTVILKFGYLQAQYASCYLSTYLFIIDNTKKVNKNDPIWQS